jgi:hypothetical protein
VTDTTADAMLVKLILVLPEEYPSVQEAIKLLARDGIECEAGYAPLHLKMATTNGALPLTEALWKRVLCIPLETEWKKRASPLLLSQNWSALRGGEKAPLSVKEIALAKENEADFGEEGLVGELVGPIAVRQGNDS